MRTKKLAVLSAEEQPDGSAYVTRIEYQAPVSLDKEMIILIGMGILFNSGCSSINPFCVLDIEKGEMLRPEFSPPYYGWDRNFDKVADRQFFFQSVN